MRYIEGKIGEKAFLVLSRRIRRMHIQTDYAVDFIFSVFHLIGLSDIITDTRRLNLTDMD